MYWLSRLKITLNLPPIQARPPIPPRIYNRLYTHLDKVLPNASATPTRSARTTRTRTPGSRNQQGELGSDVRPLPSRGTPSKEQSLALFRKASATPSKSTTGAPAVLGVGLPPWTRPVIKFLCAETGQPQLGPTMVAGMDAIVAPFGRRTDDAWINQNITALLGAVYFFVTIRVVAITRDEPMTKEPFALQRREILKLLERARAEAQVVGPSAEDAWDEWEDVKTREFNSAVMQMEEQGWLEGDWFTGIDDIVRPRDIGQLGGDGAEVAEDDVEVEVPTQTRRSDMMYQDKYDYLSETRRADYSAWKADILQRITALEGAAVTSTAMEVDA